MEPLRLLLVTRRFWPLIGGPQNAMANLATELSARGCRVTILTAQWQPDWPSRIAFHDVEVVRLPHPPRDGWGTFRYAWSLRRWLRRHKGRYDLVYVSMLKHEASAVIRAVGHRVPVVIKAEAAGLYGDCLWQIEAPWARRIKRRCLKAAALVGPSRAVERELQAAGYPRRRIHYLPDGVPVPPRRNAQAKARARSVLAEANLALRMPDHAPLAVYTGRLHLDRRLQYLIAAWQPIVARWPNARLWLAGEGPYRNGLLRQIEALNLGGRVVLSRVFDQVDELLAAADLFLLPSPQAGTSRSLLEAMAAGLPIIASDTPGNREVITDGRHGLLVTVEERGALSAAIIRLLDQPNLAAQLGTAAREHAADEFSLAKMADQHVTLFQRLVHQDSSRPPTKDDP